MIIVAALALLCVALLAYVVWQIRTSRNVLISYRQDDHGSFDEEWPPHKNASGWWYVTGYLNDVASPDKLYSYQFTVINIKYVRNLFYILQVAFTDMQTGRHLFKQTLRFRSRKVYVDGDTVSFLPFGVLKRGENEMSLRAKAKGLELDLRLDLGKGAAWHGDNGVLVMGLPDDPDQRTVYYSYTNMPTSGTIVLGTNSGHETLLEVRGKSWFDRQWGPYRLVDSDSFWEWFSIRFFDDEEVMLFAFPQHPYYDGTYVDRGGMARLVRDYEYSCHRIKKVHRTQFSEGWDVTLPGIKEEYYRITPMTEGQCNGGYYELMAQVTNNAGAQVGYCFAELLPGVRQPDKRKFTLLSLIRNRM
jgi:predicted secreted hydrolase